MAIETSFIIVAGILFLGLFGEYIFNKTKIPDVIWLLLLGIIMGSVFKWVSAGTFTAVAPFFTTFALIFLLFEAGINIDIKQFIKSAPQGMRLSILSFLFSFIIIFIIGIILQKGIALSLLMGAILAGISSAVVLPVIKNLTLRPETKLSLVFDSALSDVLCILTTVTLIEILTSTGVDFWNIASGVLSSFLIAIALGVATGFAWSTAIRKLKSHQFMLTLATMLIVYSVTELLGANGAIAGLVFGLILGNTKKIAEAFQKDADHTITKSEKTFYSEVAFFIKTFFFVYLGILIDFSSPISFLWALLVLIGAYAARPFAVWLSFGKGTPSTDVKILETLIPKGLAAAVLVQLPIEAGVTGASSLVNIALGVILLSIIASTVFVYLIQKNKYPGAFKFLYKKYQE